MASKQFPWIVERRYAQGFIEFECFETLDDAREFVHNKMEDGVEREGDYRIVQLVE